MSESWIVADQDDLLPLPPGDFRRVRSYLGPPDEWPSPNDLIPEGDWDNVINLPTDVLLKTSSDNGSWASRINKLKSDWISATPVGAEAPFMSGPSLIAYEEFDAVVFNAPQIGGSCDKALPPDGHTPLRHAARNYRNLNQMANWPDSGHHD